MGMRGEQGNIHGLKALNPRGDAGGVPQGAHQHIGKARAEEVEADADHDLLAVAVNGQHPQDQRQKCTGGAATAALPRGCPYSKSHGGEKPAEEHGALNADVDDTRPLADGAGQSAQCNGCGQPDGRGRLANEIQNPLFSSSFLFPSRQTQLLSRCHRWPSIPHIRREATSMTIKP